MPGQAELRWPTAMSEPLAAAVHELIGPVVSLGGAVGWLSPPARGETDSWLTGALAATAAGDGALCTAWRDGGLAAMGLWRRDRAMVRAHSAELVKIMVAPQARGGRLGLLVTQELVAAASGAGIETLTLGVRGNNHLAIQLYAEAGFAEYSRLPNVLEVGDERFDEVRMYRKLSVPAHLRLRGSAPSGPGYSPASDSAR